MDSYFESFGKYLLFTKYLTSANMPTTQQKKGTKNLFEKIVIAQSVQ